MSALTSESQFSFTVSEACAVGQLSQAAVRPAAGPGKHAR